jgi:hypothetical protein
MSIDTTPATTVATTKAPPTTVATTTTIPLTTTAAPTTTAAAITVAEIEDRISEEWPGTVPAGMWADPRTWSCRQVTSGSLAPGSAVECVPAITDEGQFPVLTVLVLDSAGTSTIGQAGVVYDVLNPEAIVPILGLDGFCRDILADGTALTGLPTAEMEYFGAVLYWFMEGMPERMDADRNAVPCETLVPASVVSSVWSGGWVEDMGAPLAEALVGTWEGVPSVPSGWVDIGSVRFEFKPDGTYSVRHDGEVSGGLYWGDDTDSPMRIYEVFDPAPGQGWITVFWEPGTTQTGRLENITIKDGRLHFELWSDWGERPPYGPVVYDLTQTG